jgi:hypothetical protein
VKQAFDACGHGSPGLYQSEISNWGTPQADCLSPEKNPQTIGLLSAPFKRYLTRPQCTAFQLLCLSYSSSIDAWIACKGSATSPFAAKSIPPKLSDNFCSEHRRPRSEGPERVFPYEEHWLGLWSRPRPKSQFKATVSEASLVAELCWMSVPNTISSRCHQLSVS